MVKIWRFSFQSVGLSVVKFSISDFNQACGMVNKLAFLLSISRPMVW